MSLEPRGSSDSKSGLQGGGGEGTAVTSKVRKVAMIRSGEEEKIRIS